MHSSRHKRGSWPQILTANCPTRHQTGQVPAGLQEGKGSSVWFLQSSSFLAFPFDFLRRRRQLQNRRRDADSCKQKQKRHAQSQALKAAVKQEKKQKDTELSIRSSMTECKFRQEQQRAEAAKKRAAKKVGPRAFNFFLQRLNFWSRGRMTVLSTQNGCIQHKAILHLANHLQRKEPRKHTLRVNANLCKHRPTQYMHIMFHHRALLFCFGSRPIERHRKWFCNSWCSMYRATLFFGGPNATRVA